MTLGLQDLGGTDPAVAIEGLRVQQVLDMTYDFGTGHLAGAGRAARRSPRAPCTRWHEATAGRAAAIGSCRPGSGNGNCAGLELHQLGVSAADVPNGTYQVTLYAGRPGGFPHDQMGIFLEGQQVDTVITAAWQVVEQDVPGHGGRRPVDPRSAGPGGTDPAVAIEGLRVQQLLDATYDFGTGTSPVRPAARR